MTIDQIDKRISYLCELADRSYIVPGERERIQEEVYGLMDQRDELRNNRRKEK